MKLCKEEGCEPLCDFCKNFDSDKWICKITSEEMHPGDLCEENFVCFRLEIE